MPCQAVCRQISVLPGRDAGRCVDRRSGVGRAATRRWGMRQEARRQHASAGRAAGCGMLTSEYCSILNCVLIQVQQGASASAGAASRASSASPGPVLRFIPLSLRFASLVSSLARWSSLHSACLRCGWLGGALGLALAVWLALADAPKRRQTAQGVPRPGPPGQRALPSGLPPGAYQPLDPVQASLAGTNRPARSGQRPVVPTGRLVRPVPAALVVCLLCSSCADGGVTPNRICCARRRSLAKRCAPRRASASCLRSPTPSAPRLGERTRLRRAAVASDCLGQRPRGPARLAPRLTLPDSTPSPHHDHRPHHPWPAASQLRGSASWPEATPSAPARSSPALPSASPARRRRTVGKSAKPWPHPPGGFVPLTAPQRDRGRRPFAPSATGVHATALGNLDRVRPLEESATFGISLPCFCSPAPRWRHEPLAKLVSPGRTSQQPSGGPAPRAPAAPAASCGPRRAGRRFRSILPTTSPLACAASRQKRSGWGWWSARLVLTKSTPLLGSFCQACPCGGPQA